jgi:hypothetical protein
MEGLESEMNSLIRGFQVWLDDHFSVRAGSRSVFHVVDSYSSGPEGALWNFYALFEQFQKAVAPTPIENRISMAGIPKVDLSQMLRSIRERPALYVGYPHFSGVHTYLAGHRRAGKDLGLPRTLDEKLFDEFKLWIEKEKLNGGKPRPWFKLVGFCSFHDCGGLSSRSTYSVFFELLDEFAAKIGQPSLFKVD